MHAMQCKANEIFTRENHRVVVERIFDPTKIDPLYGIYRLIPS